jgi:hypothetical protein
VALPHAAVALDVLAHPADDLFLALVGQLGIEQQQDLVRIHVPGTSFLRSGRPHLQVPLGTLGT